MGTNYYRKRLPTEENVQRVAQLVREGKYDECCVDINKINAIDFIKEFSDGVHLCKISYGWQVCFDHNWGKYYMPTRRDLTAFLSEPGTCIFDEYGAKYANRNGGYTRIVKIGQRKGDGALEVVLELV